jgi:Zn-dependent protease
VPIIATERPVIDDDGVPVLEDDGTPRTETTGFLGVSPTQERRPLSILEFPGEMADMIGQTFHALFTLPGKLVEITQVAFSDVERDPNGPIGMVGVGRVAGEIVGTDRLEVIEKVQVGLSLLGSLNLFLFAFNMVPLLPLDGGHIAVGLYEGGRRQVNLRRGRGVIGPFDTARLLPLTYAVVGVLLCVTVLLLYVDIFKPVILFG